MTLAGRVALVTGGDGGIGSAIVRELAAAGAKVTLSAPDEKSGKAMANEIGVPFIRLDVTDEALWRQAVRTVEGAVGPISILVNNAGVMGAGLIEEIDLAHWRHVLDVNLTGALLGMRAVMPSMRRAKGGAIVNINSVAGTTGYVNRAAYVASKWAQRGLTRTAALEFAKDNVRVNSVCPGPIRTPLTAGYAEETWHGQPIPRFGEAHEVARLVAFLVDGATYSTASDFFVDGGITAGQPLRD